MAIEETLYSRLSGYAGLIALVSTRITPNITPQNSSMPAVNYRRISSPRFSAMGVDSPVVKSRFQINACGSTYPEASAVRAQIIAALQRWRNGSNVQDTFILNETDLYDDTLKQHQIAIDVEINYSE